jgi:hypoxanthine phosphoribosyltransferase
MNTVKIPANSEPLFSAKEISLIVEKMGQELTTHLKETPNTKEGDALFVGILKGSWMFMADLVRKVDFPLHVEFIRASSYGASKESSGQVKVESLNGGLNIKNRDIFLVDEIIDTGRTLLAIKKLFLEAGARSVKVVALLDKKSRREVEINADFVGVEIPDAFVIGYGLDWAERYRDLSDIRVVS